MPSDTHPHARMASRTGMRPGLTAEEVVADTIMIPDAMPVRRAIDPEAEDESLGMSARMGIPLRATMTGNASRRADEEAGLREPVRLRPERPRPGRRTMSEPDPKADGHEPRTCRDACCGLRRAQSQTSRISRDHSPKATSINSFRSAMSDDTRISHSGLVHISPEPNSSGSR